MVRLFFLAPGAITLFAQTALAQPSGDHPVKRPPLAQSLQGAAKEAYTAATFLYGCYFRSGASMNCWPAAVGLAPSGVGLWGQLDLAGNVEGWALADYPATDNCTDCAGIDQFRATQGGNYTTDVPTLLATYNATDYPSNRYAARGFRCARMP